MTLGRVIGKPVYADVDGDGHKDRAVLRVAGRKFGSSREALVVSLSTGRTVHLVLFDFDRLDRLLGHADVNGDGRAELIVFLSGNTEFSAAVVTLVNRRLVAAKSRNSVPAFAAHGAACGQCTEDARCQNVAGQQRLVETYSNYVSKRGEDLTGYEAYRTHDNTPPASHRRRWRAIVYDLRGRRLIRVKTTRGTEPPGAALPRNYQFEGALSCGTAHWSLSTD